jgi:hypothetical protein
MEVVYSTQREDRYEVVIKSSDDKLLHLHSTTLMHHSKVFRAIYNLGANMEPIAMDYKADDLSYFFSLLYQGVQRSALDDLLQLPPTPPLTPVIRLAIQYDCLLIATALVDTCNVRASTPKFSLEKETTLHKLLDANHACSLINMAHSFGLTRSVEDYLDGLVELAVAKPTCCATARGNWRLPSNENYKYCPYGCKKTGWRLEGYSKAAKLQSASFYELNAPLPTLLFAKFFDKTR